MSQPRLSDFVKPPPKPTDLEVDQQWWELRARMRRRTQVRRAMAAGGAMLALTVAAWVGLRTESAP